MGRLFLRVCIDVVTIKIIVAMYVAYRILCKLLKIRGGGLGARMFFF